MLFRRRQRLKIARSSVGLFAMAWLSMAAQPCVMALEALSDADHGSDCPHCPQPEHPCHDNGDSPKERCGYIDSYDYDGRTPDVPKPVVVDQVLTLLPVDEDVCAPVRLKFKSPPSLDAESPPGRYTLIYCVFLK